ncbi:hypothetical protein S245_049012, partial [Arachis hypogaea]
SHHNLLQISVTASELSRLRHLNSEEGWIDICMDQGLEESKGEGFIFLLLVQACNSHSVTYVPLYDTLGPNAVEFIINHAQVSIAFVQENKIPSILSYFGQCSSNLITIVSFGNVSTVQKKEAEEYGTSCFSWEEFFQLGTYHQKRRLTFAHSYKAASKDDGSLNWILARRINSQISSGGAFGSALFQYAYNYKLEYLEKGLPQDKAAPFFDRLVFDKIKQGLGGRKAATKRMDMQASKEFLAELKVLTHVHHLNL